MPCKAKEDKIYIHQEPDAPFLDLWRHRRFFLSCLDSGCFRSRVGGGAARWQSSDKTKKETRVLFALWGNVTRCQQYTVTRKSYFQSMYSLCASRQKRKGNSVCILRDVWRINCWCHTSLNQIVPYILNTKTHTPVMDVEAHTSFRSPFLNPLWPQHPDLAQHPLSLVDVAQHRL